MAHPRSGSAVFDAITRVEWSPEQRALWSRIQAHHFERDDQALDFTRRLARDRGWHLDFARGAVAEYRRFCFLACLYDTPVTPSEEVDEVWHQHLTYSRDYWQLWCGQALERPLHHDPTAGGPSEQARYCAQYAETLARYEAHFGPPDPLYWPGTRDRFRAKPRYRIVDLDRVWVLPRPRRPSWLARTAAALALTMVPQSARALPLNPLDWTAEPFLKLYIPLAAFALVLALILRHALRLGEQTGNDPRLDVVELGYLAGGVRRAAHTVIVGMLAAGAMRFSPFSGQLTVEDRRASLPPHLQPFRSVLESGSQSSLMRLLRPRLTQVREVLSDAGLSPSAARLRTITITTLALVGPVVIFGLAKIAVGLSRGKPVGILVVLTATTALLGTVMLLNRPVRTGAGDIWLHRHRERHARAVRAPRASGDEIVLAFALIGAAALNGTPYEAYARAASSSGGGCGSSGGDGGGGGGGCGGCGGGCGS